MHSEIGLIYKLTHYLGRTIRATGWINGIGLTFVSAAIALGCINKSPPRSEEAMCSPADVIGLWRSRLYLSTLIEYSGVTKYFRTGEIFVTIIYKKIGDWWYRFRWHRHRTRGGFMNAIRPKLKVSGITHTVNAINHTSRDVTCNVSATWYDGRSH